MTLASIDQVTTAAAQPEQAPALTDYAGWSTSDVLRGLLRRVFPGRIALVSSFRTESAVPHLLPRIDRAAPDGDPRAARWAGRGKTECGTHLLHVPTLPIPALTETSRHA